MESAITDSPTTDGAPKKLRRITRACDYCHKRSIRCRFPGDTDDTRCQNCIDFDQPCRFDRVVKRRGAKPRSQTISADSTPPSKHDYVGEDVCRTPSIAAPPNRHAEWKAPPIASQSLILERVEIYFEIVYPIFPFFHRPTLRRRIARGDHLKDRFFFAATMAICALVTARIADRAVYNPRWDLAKLSQIRSEVYYAAAVKECGNAGALEQANFDLLRTCALLAVTAIQYGKFREMQTHLGKYHTLVAMDGLHDEENWPSDIGIVEVEERRRLFWSMYTLDIYSSIFWNGVIRCREQQSNVSFTTEIDDDCFDDTGYRIESPSSTNTPMTISNTTHLPFDTRSSSWLYGWNFMTDLYRILEHVMAEFRDWRRNKRPLVGGIFSDHSTLSASNTRDTIMSMYNSLPQCFRETNEITCDPSRDRYGFQAANITATVQLLRMVLFSSGGASIEERCNIASEAVSAFMRIPVQYLQAISSPLLHHLAGIGSILGTVFENPLTEPGYLQLRVVLLALAQLLENLDHGVHSTASADKLRSIVAKLDTQMEHQRQTITISPYTKPPHLNTLRTATASPFTITHSHSAASHSTGSSRQDSFSAGSRDSMDPTSHVHHGNVPFVVAVPPDIRQGWPQGWGYDFMQFPEN